MPLPCTALFQLASAATFHGAKRSTWRFSGTAKAIPGGSRLLAKRVSSFAQSMIYLVIWMRILGLCNHPFSIENTSFLLNDSSAPRYLRKCGNTDVQILSSMQKWLNWHWNEINFSERPEHWQLETQQNVPEVGVAWYSTICRFYPAALQPLPANRQLCKITVDDNQFLHLKHLYII